MVQTQPDIDQIAAIFPEQIESTQIATATFPLVIIFTLTLSARKYAV